MSEYSIGVDDHYAWANLVSVTTVDSDERLVDRRRVDLLDQLLPASPYHRDSLTLTAREAERLIRAVRTSAGHHAKAALSTLITELAPATCRSIAMRVPPLPRLPDTVAEAHADAAIRNRADGMIYHQAITEAAGQLGLRVFYFEKATILALAATTHGTTARDLERRVKGFGRVLGPPWRKGHIVACAGAIWAHASAAPSAAEKR
jgi:hypothetical protein